MLSLTWTFHVTKLNVLRARYAPLCAFTQETKMSRRLLVCKTNRVSYALKETPNMNKYNIENKFKFESLGGLWICRSRVPCTRIPKNSKYDFQHQMSEPQGGDLVVDDALGMKSDITRVETSNDSLGTTAAMSNDAVVGVGEIHNQKNIPENFFGSSDDGLPASVKSYLGKPYALESLSLSTTDGPSTFPIYRTSAGLRANKAYYDKLDGVLSVKYTTVVTLQINANRFQQGRYILAFIPTAGSSFFQNPLSPNPRIDDWIMLHRATKVEITQLHHVELDINTDTSVQLRIPYSSAFPGLPWNVSSNSMTLGDPGVFFMYPYHPLAAATGNTTATGTLWVHYEDVEVHGNTLPSVPVPTAAFEPQSRNGVSSSKNVDLFDNEVRQDGPVTSALKYVTELSDASVKIPLLSSITGKANWAIRAAASVASSMGWSKPPQVKTIERFNRFSHAYVANEDQIDDCQPLSLFSDNHVSVAPGFAGTDTDELSIDYLKGIFSFLATQPWGSSMARGTNIITGVAGPWHDIPNSNGSMSRPPVSMLCNFFTQYRGGIVIKIKVVKTEFHSGRLLFWFAPLEPLSHVRPHVNADTAYLHKTILDIRESNEFIIEIPYVSIMPWRPTEGPIAFYGEWGLDIQDTLVSPDTVMNQVQVIVEIAGAKDLEFSVPKSFSEQVVCPATYQMAWEPQSNLNSTSNPTLQEVDTVGGTTPKAMNMVYTEYCVGESVTSLRSLLKRGGNMGFISGAAATVRHLTLMPFQWAYAYSTALEAADATVDIFTHLSSMYAFQRGGVRIRFILPDTAGLNMANISNGYFETPILKKIYTIDNDNTLKWIKQATGAQLAVNTGTMGGLGIQIPYYNYLPSSSTVGQSMSSKNAFHNGLDHCGNKQLLNVQFTNVVNLPYMPVYRSGADDCNFGCFVSTVPTAPIAAVVP